MRQIGRHIDKLWILLMVAGLSWSCTDVLVDERGDQLEEYDYYIDEDGNEGIVVNVWSSKIVVMSLDESNETWGTMGKEMIEGANKDTYNREGYSVAMQHAMVNSGIHHFPAQAWCCAKNKRGQVGIGSWRLPSYYDWKYCIGTQYEYKIENLNEAIIKMGGVPLSADAEYWTCTEDYPDAFFDTPDTDAANRAICIFPNLTAYENKDKWLKNNTYKVRAIKYVYFEK